MLKSIEMTGPDRDSAIEAALRQLGMDRDDVSVEVLENGKKGFFGFGSVPTRVKISYEAPDEPVQAQSIPVAASVHEAPERKRQTAKLSITTDDTTPRLVKPAPADFTLKKPAHPEQERFSRREHGRNGERREHRARRDYSERYHAPVVPREREIIPVSHESMKKAETLATEFVSGLLDKMGVAHQIKILEPLESDQLRMEIEGPDMGPVIGRRGDTLDAIQYLGTLVLNNALDEHVRLSIDTENYRKKRVESLERLARKMALKVQKSRRSMTLEPMNPYERRIIHAALQDFNGITTYSTGTEPGRRIIIAPDHGHRSRR